MPLQGALGEYLERGWFPAVQNLSRPCAVMLLQSYARQVVARDVVDRHNMSNPRLAVNFSQIVLGANGRFLSLRKTENDLKSRGIQANRAMLAEMLQWLEDAFLVGRVWELARSVSESNNGIVKLYAIDQGLAAANTPAGVTDVGQRLEDAVYLELRRRVPGTRSPSISYLNTHEHYYEVDFVVGDALLASSRACIRLRSRWTTRGLAQGKCALEEAMSERGGCARLRFAARARLLLR